MGRASAPSNRRKNAVESFKSVSHTIGKIEKGMSLFAITRGQWSMIDAITYCLDEVGPSKISLWTWAIATYEINAFTGLIKKGGISDGTLIIDYGARKRNADLLHTWKTAFGKDSVRYVLNHAKIATIESESGFKLLLRGSMNLNFNPRFEQFDITEGGEDFELVRRIESELPILADNSPGKEVYAASKVGDAFGKEQLALFQHTKVWAK